MSFFRSKYTALTIFALVVSGIVLNNYYKDGIINLCNIHKYHLDSYAFPLPRLNENLEILTKTKIETLEQRYSQEDVLRLDEVGFDGYLFKVPGGQKNRLRNGNPVVIFSNDHSSEYYAGLRGLYFMLDDLMPKTRWQSYVGALKNVEDIATKECGNISNGDLAKILNFTAAQTTEIFAVAPAKSEQFLDEDSENIVVVSENYREGSNAEVLYYHGVLISKNNNKLMLMTVFANDIKAVYASLVESAKKFQQIIFFKESEPIII